LTHPAHPPFESGQRVGGRKEEVTELRGPITLVLLSGLAVAPTAQAATPSSRAPVVVRVTDGGFNWGDAAIGAAGGSALTLLAGGTVLGARQRPEHDEETT
jgi:hypothetical protein